MSGLGYWPFDVSITTADRVNIGNAIVGLLGQMDQLRVQINKIQNETLKGRHTNTLQGIESLLRQYQTMTSAADAKMDRTKYNEMILYLNEVAPRTLAALNELIAGDIGDPTGKSSDAALEQRNLQIEAEAKSREWLTDPGKVIQEGVLSAQKGILGLQWEVLKTFWPALLVAGGIAGLVFFGPALGTVAKKLAGRGNGG